MYADLHVKYPLFLSEFNETWIFSTDFRIPSDIICHENPSSGSRVIPCGGGGGVGRTERQTDRHDKAVAVRSRSYYTHNCGTYSEFSVILADGLRESEALTEHQNIPCASLHLSFTKVAFFLYKLISFGPRTMPTSSLAITTTFFTSSRVCTSITSISRAILQHFSF
jgi:hypothetical protein